MKNFLDKGERKMGERYLIINADDFGMCRSANLATYDLFEKGGITSETVMVPCGWSPEACKWAGNHPEYAVGVHLTFTSEWSNYRWGPVSLGNNSSLCDKFGYFYHENDEFEENCDIDEVENEIRAQVTRAKLLGLKPSHLDNHMGSLYGLNGNYEVMPKTFEVCGELGYAFRMFKYFRAEEIPEDFPEEVPIEVAQMLINGYVKSADENKVPLIDYLLFPDWNDERKASFETYREHMLNRLSNIPEGISETFIHPAFESDEMKGITATWRERSWEYKLFSDPKTRQHLESKGIKYINYHDVVRLRAQEGK